MEVIDGQWTMFGLKWRDKDCLHAAEELLALVNEVGFLPLMGNDIPGFSVENRTDPSFWWTGNEAKDPWEWRAVLSRTGLVAYGKFFANHAGYVSKEWFPYFANFRRDGYDFDASYDDGLATLREKKIMDLFVPNGYDIDHLDPAELPALGCEASILSNVMKERAGFGKGGEKNFDGTLAKLQMKGYLVTKDFCQRTKKSGECYGWAVAKMTPPEYLWGYDFVTSQYREKPEDSYRKIITQIQKHYDADEKTIRKVLGK